MITRPILRARSSCGSGGKPEKDIDFPFGEQLHGGFARTWGDPGDVLVRVEPDVGGHHRDIQVAAGAERPDAHPLALQVADGSDGLVREQLVAPGMHARQRRDRLAGIEKPNDPCAGVHAKVSFTACDSVAS